MQFPGNILDPLSPGILKLVAAGSITLLFSLAGYVFKSESKKRKREAQETNAKLDKLVELNLKFSTNCFPTIQANTGRSVDVLERIEDRLAEQNGYLKGKLE